MILLRIRPKTVAHNARFVAKISLSREALRNLYRRGHNFCEWGADGFLSTPNAKDLRVLTFQEDVYYLLKENDDREKIDKNLRYAKSHLILGVLVSALQAIEVGARNNLKHQGIHSILLWKISCLLSADRLKRTEPQRGRKAANGT